MNLVTHKKYKGDKLMPWAKGTVVSGAKGYVFLCGNTGTTEDYNPKRKLGGAVGDAETQWRTVLANIKADLEALGSSLEHLVKLTFYIKRHFRRAASWVRPISAWTCWTRSLPNIVQSMSAPTTRHPRR